VRDHDAPARRHNHVRKRFAPVATCLSVAARRKETTNQHNHTGWIGSNFSANASGLPFPVHHQASYAELFGLFVRMRMCLINIQHFQALFQEVSDFLT
jgi:hypothetical protein